MPTDIRKYLSVLLMLLGIVFIISLMPEWPLPGEVTTEALQNRETSVLSVATPEFLGAKPQN